MTTAAPSTLDSRREIYRERIVAAAEREFARVGYQDAKVSAIAKRAEVSLATVYKYFDGKAAIWDALHAHRMGELVTTGLGPASSEQDPFRQLIAMSTFAVHYFAEHRYYLDLHIKEGLSWATADTSIGRGRQQGAWVEGRTLMAASVQRAIDAGELTDLPAAEAAGLMISALQVFLTEWVNQGRKRPAGEVADDLTVHLERIFSRR